MAMSGISAFVDKGPSDTSNLLQHLRSKVQRSKPKGTQVRENEIRLARLKPCDVASCCAGGCTKKGEEQTARPKGIHLKVS